MFAQDIALYVSAITELELFSFPALTDEDISVISQLLTSVVIIPVAAGPFCWIPTPSLSPQDRR
jgi:hypothetical protein